MLNEIELSRADLNLPVLFETVLEERHAAERGAAGITSGHIGMSLGAFARVPGGSCEKAPESVGNA